MRQPRLDGLTMDETKNTEEHPRPAEQHPESAAGEQDRHEPRDAAEGQATAGAGAPAGPTAVELQDRWQRAVAELDNLRKRYERQLDQARRAERDRVTAAWLPVLDHLELALQHAHADPATIVAGIQAVHQQALDVLAGLGYRRGDEGGGGGAPPGTGGKIHRPPPPLARRYHPDINKEPGAEDRFKEITEAYEVLSDPDHRARYDRFGPAWRQVPDDYDARAGAPFGAGHSGGRRGF